MAEVTSYSAGTPSWVDLMTSDPAAARDFYGNVFGWDFEIGPEETGHYAMCRVRGHNVAGIGASPDENVPTAWNTYLASDDIEATAKQIAAAGGTVAMGPMDVMTSGRVLFAQDPTGAWFGAWEARDHIGATLVNEPGCVSWNELATRDLATAQAFYSDVFGYTWEDVDTRGGPDYGLFAVSERAVGGAMQMTDQWPSEVPAYWMPYFSTADVDATAALASELGGAVQVPAMDSEYGRVIVLGDPQGGVFTAITPPAAA